MWKQPCSLAYEKSLINFFFVKRKQYRALKYEPGGKLSVHIAELACKKSDATKIKSSTLKIMLQMISHMDIDGALQYSQDLYDLIAVKMHAIEKVNEILDPILNDIDLILERSQSPGYFSHINLYLSNDEFLELKNNSKKANEKSKWFIETNQEDKIKHANLDDGLIPDIYCTSRQRVNNIQNPKSVADKTELKKCKLAGKLPEEADMITSVIRNASVQAGSHICSILEQLVKKPPSTRFASLISDLEKDLLKLTGVEYRRVIKSYNLQEKKDFEEKMII